MAGHEASDTGVCGAIKDCDPTANAGCRAQQLIDGHRSAKLNDAKQNDKKHRKADSNFNDGTSLASAVVTQRESSERTIHLTQPENQVRVKPHPTNCHQSGVRIEALEGQSNMHTEFLQDQ